MDLLLITLLEWIYLIYMFFFFETNYYIGPSILEYHFNKMSFFVHHTGRKESKICDFGRLFVLVFIAFSLFRLNNNVRTWNLVLDGTVIVLASLLNLNAVLYLLPVILLETLILF